MRITDKMRLDFMEKHNITGLSCFGGYDIAFNGMRYVAGSIRKAIDAAIRQESKNG